MVGRIFLGRYETIRLLGEGGMGRVYLARQLDLGRQVVVKVMHDHIAADAKFRERFQRETLLMARFQHPYVVTLYDASLNDPEGPCIVMEYIRGISLESMLHRDGRMRPHRLSRLLNQLCEALQAAHNEGIVHRDLKPANLMVIDADTPYEKIKVMDFGLAKITQRRSYADEPMNDTGADFAVGTPGYISPEQVRGDEVDHRADLYSVGVMLYELLTGRLPFNGSETMDVLLAHAQDKPPSFADVGIDDIVSPSIEKVVMSCLAKNADERPHSARQLAETFENALLEDEARMARGHKSHSRQSHSGEDGKVTKTNLQASTPMPSKILADVDPAAVVHQVTAWMPESVAAYKLRGFVDEVGGQVIESVPGRICVRLGGSSVYSISGSGPLSWLGIGKKSAMDIELRLERNHPTKHNLLTITVIMKPSNEKLAASPAWRLRCNELFCDLRAFLMGSDIGAP